MTPSELFLSPVTGLVEVEEGGWCVTKKSRFDSDDCFFAGVGGAVVLAFVVVCLFSLRFSVFLVERRWLEPLNFFGGRLLLLDRETLASLLLLELPFFLQVRAIL